MSVQLPADTTAYKSLITHEVRFKSIIIVKKFSFFKMYKEQLMPNGTHAR